MKEDKNMTAYEFVRNLWENSDNYDSMMDIETAQQDLDNFRSEFWDVPEDLTAEEYASIWNELVNENTAEN